MQLEDVRIKAQGIGGVLAELSSLYDVPIGLEVALEDDELTLHSIEFEKGPLAEFLTRFVARYDRYAWEIRDGVVNIFPRENHRDLLAAEVLETTIGSFSIGEQASCYGIVKSLAETPEIKNVLEINGTTLRGPSPGGFYIQHAGRKFTLDVSDATLKAILNRLIKESPTASFWSIGRSSYDQALLIGLSAAFDDDSRRNPETRRLRTIILPDEVW
ncbi:MAG TPA: hypothetical protein VD861_07485 [Pyrinomonadaceae bacterium]|nr:hypothetical protein [Pyrinomonadaceae bacterium]